jgi:hypothetical protein
MTTFDDVWADIVSRLSAGSSISNWGSVKGYTGKIARIERVDQEAITVSGEETATPRCIRKAEFARIFEHWEGYKNGTVSRSDLVDLSFNTTYILSILQWRESDHT